MTHAAPARSATPEPPGGKPRHDLLGLTLRGVGQILITLGLVVLLFVVYEVWITNYFSHEKQRKVHQALEQEWKDGQLELPVGQLAHGKGLVNLYIPRFGMDYVQTVVKGVGESDLEKGPGWYTDTQLPGQAGNFAIAGHRVGKGEPFLNLDHLKPGDPVVVEDAGTWWVYCVIGNQAGGQDASKDADVCNPNATGGKLSATDDMGVPGREIVKPSDGQVVWPVPSKASVPEPYPHAYLTMTTCTPKFSATDRMIVHAVLDPAYPKGIPKTKVGDKYSTDTPAEITALYSLVGA